MTRYAAFVATVLTMAAVTLMGLTGCGSIHTASVPASRALLTANPPVIIVAPFNNDTGRWLVGREGIELFNFKHEFTNNFEHQLEVRLSKLAPVEERWKDLPDHGWLVAGEFVTVDQGSRALRSLIGTGFGETTLQTRVYVYDLSVSKTEYVLCIRTGVPDGETGSGSGATPAGVATAFEPATTTMAIGSGLKLDTTRTAREIANALEKYVQ